jgi:HSP20 family protein
MTLIRWSPAPLSTLRDLTVHDEFDRLFDGFFTRGLSRGDLNAVFTPAADIEETDEAFVVRMDLPGVSQKDVKVSLMGDTLTIRGERKQESKTQNGGRHRIERVHGTFERSFVLDRPMRGDQVKAQVKDGVLEVRVPKAEEARLREIEVQVA